MLALAVAGALVVLAVALGLVVQATVARARAQSVADLSALAAAREAQRAAFGEPSAVDPCVRAGEVAIRNGGRVAACEESGVGVVRVGVVVRAAVGEARARSRAGPRS